MRGDVVGDGEKPREAGTIQRHTARTVPAAAELGIGAWEARVGRGGREGAGGPAEARGRERGAAACVAGTGGCGDVSRARWRWGREQGTGGFLGICRENPAEMVPGGAGFVAGSGGFVAGKVSGQVLQPVLGYGHGRVPAARRVVGGSGFWGGGLPGCRIFGRGCGRGGVAEMPETLRGFEALKPNDVTSKRFLKLFLADHRSKRKISSYIRHLEPRMSTLRWYPWYLYTAILDIEVQRIFLDFQTFQTSSVK
ncbi:hypothetical protein C8J57DRAFT_1259680 [Mycena rebaudengoi]|nr:hypothetical protein C8J57DRAFT_1259680 [Mycena rebaudengoi]